MQHKSSAMLQFCTSLLTEQTVRQLAEIAVLSAQGTVRFLPNGVSGGVIGQVGHAIDFNSNARVDVSKSIKNGISDADGSYTAELWFNADDSTNGTQSLLSLSKTGAAPSQADAFFINLTASGKLRVVHRSPPSNMGGTDFTSTTTFASGTWYHIVVVNEVRQGAGTLTLYVDGVEDSPGQSTTGLIDFPIDVQIGELRDLNRHFRGLVDELAIYSTGHSIEDITRHHSAGSRIADPGQPTFDASVPPALDQPLELVDNGTYTLTVTASDGDGGFAESITTFEVQNVGPSIDLSGSSLSFDGGDYVGETFAYNVDAVSDPGVLDKLTYLWEVTNDNGDPILTSDAEEFEFVPSYAGHYEVCLTVPDADGCSPRTPMATLTILPVVNVALDDAFVASPENPTRSL